MKKIDELKQLAAAGKWPPATDEEAARILATDDAEKKVSVQPKKLSRINRIIALRCDAKNGYEQQHPDDPFETIEPIGKRS